MEENKQNDRLRILKIIILVVFIIIFVKILYLTVFKYDHYSELAENKTFKKILTKAPRGEIRDRNGKLLAGSKNQFTVQVSGNDLIKTGKNSTAKEASAKANKTSLELMNLLEENKENYVDEFPIYVENGKYFYTYDKNIRDYKKNNNIPLEYNAKQSFYFILDKAIKDGALSNSDRKLQPVQLQKKLNANGYYPPILVKKWMFADERDKRDWLEVYGIKDKKLPDAKTAFSKIRDSLNIDKNTSDTDARKIMIVRDLVKSQRFSQYNPVTIAKDIKSSTISQIEEKAMDLVGVSVAVEPVRYYPNDNLASHVIGYIGRIPSALEDEYKNKGYEKDNLVGLSGVEKSYEKQLKGKDGYSLVKVDSLGRISQKLETKESKAGDTIYLTIDKDLQKIAESSLKEVVDHTTKGQTFKSKFGNVNIGTYAPNAKSGAIIALDPKTGEVLASASYPDYNLNEFAKGISEDAYKALQPKNPNDLIGANPLLNLVTQGAFQPGSTFKIVTGMAALENGLDPNYSIQDKGYIKLGKNSKIFADMEYHHGGGNDGIVNLYKAIQVSCNVYFATIATGVDWNFHHNPGIKMNADKILDTAKLFGLNDSTGLNRQIEERPGKVPSTSDKLNSTKKLLKDRIEKTMKDDFKDITAEKNAKEYEDRINKIVSWVDESKIPGRAEAMKRLKKMDIKDNKIEKDADDIVFNYLNQSKWTVGDTFILSIGQGENAYTPAQIARFFAAVANGGKLADLTVVNKTVSSNLKTSNVVKKVLKKISFKNPEKLKVLLKGMKLGGRAGTGKRAYANFPIDVGTKTGTADKDGKMPTKNECDYLKSHISSYSVNYDDASKLADKMKKNKEKELTNAKIKEIKQKLKDKNIDDKEKKELEDQLKNGVKQKLDNTDKVNSQFLRKAIKELNPNITDDQIDRFKQDYTAFSWSVSIAPIEDPKIVVVCVIPQGSSSAFSLFPSREVIGQYFGLLDNKGDKNNNNSDNSNNKEKDKKGKDNPRDASN